MNGYGCGGPHFAASTQGNDDNDDQAAPIASERGRLLTRTDPRLSPECND